jgi:hypothetical protein
VLTNGLHLGDPEGSLDDAGERVDQLRELAFRSAVVGAVAGHHLWSSQMSNIEAVGRWMTIVKDHLFVEST